MREGLTILLAAVLVVQPVIGPWAQAAQPAASSQEPKSEKPTLRERALEIPPQSFVEVRLLNKEKVRGRLAEVTDEGLTLQVAKGDKIQTRKVAFSEVKSIKVTSSKGSEAGKAVGYGLAGIGALILLLFILHLSAST